MDALSHTTRAGFAFKYLTGGGSADFALSHFAALIPPDYAEAGTRMTAAFYISVQTPSRRKDRCQ